MANNQKNGSPSDDLELLKKQNAALQLQVDNLTAERDAYLKHIYSLAKQNIPSEEEVQGWMAEEKVEGTLLDFINEVRNEK